MLNQLTISALTAKLAKREVSARDLVETRLHGLAGGDFAFDQFGGECGNGELVEHRKFLTTDEHG